jgi:hypothetical protein
VIIFSIIFGVFGLLGILITLGNSILFFAERKDKRQKGETKRESSEGLMLSENVGGGGNPELRSYYPNTVFAVPSADIPARFVSNIVHPSYSI